MSQFTGKSLLDRRKKGGKQMPIAINQNIFVDKIEIKPTYSKITFANDDGQSVIKFLFDPKVGGESPYPNSDETVDDAFNRVYDQRVDWFVDLLVALKAEEEVEGINVSGLDSHDIDSYKRFVEDTKKIVSNYADNRVNLKVRYDNKGQWPFVPDSYYVESYTEGIPPSIQYTKKELERYLEPKSIDVKKETVVNASNLY